MSNYESECKAGLNRFLAQPSCHKNIIKKIERCFLVKEGLTIYHGLADTFLVACGRSLEVISLSIFPQWLASKARKNPFVALEILEKLVVLINMSNASLRTHRTTELIETLVEIEREADDLDDPDMIRRTIALQDQFLEMDLYGMNALLDSSART